MDILVLGVVVVVLTGLVYLLATLGTKETPFEEAVAEQRHKREQESAQTKAEKQHKKPKVRKLKGKKDDTELMGATIAQEVEPEPEPEPTPPPPPVVVEPEPLPQPTQEKKKEKKKKKEKEREVEEVPRKMVVEEVHEALLVKTEAAKVEAAPEPATPSPPAAKEATKEVVVEASVVAAKVEEVDAADPPIIPIEKAPAPAQDKKKKKEKQKNDITTLSESKLLPMVQRAPLSGNEIQTLIDALLNKQQQNNAGGDWVKKGRVDPITQLKRQLEEVGNRLREKDEAHSALTAKITDLCADLHGERSRSSKLKAQLDESIANHTRQQEASAASAQAAQATRLNELRTSLEQEYQTKIQQQQQLVEQLQSTTNESEVVTLRGSLSEAEMQAKVLRQEHQELTQRCQQYEEHIRALEEKRAGEDAARNAQLSEMQAQLQNADAARAQALSDLAAIDAERDALSEQLASENTKFAQIQHKFEETINEKAEVDSRLIQVESELCSVRQVVLDQNTQIERLKEEKESLASQSVRPAAEGQENGDIHAEQTPAHDTAHLESLMKEKESLIEEKSSEIAHLNKEITRLKEDLESQRAKNNEASGEVEEEKAKVRAVLRRIFPEVVVDDALDQGAFLSEFESKALQVATQTAQSSEPEVVEKVVEVVKEVEVMVEDPALKSQVEELSKQNAELRTQVEDLQKTPAPAADDSKRVGELEEEVRAVTDKVAHYQRVLADTENLLKSLQASVESEEVAWNKRLSEKDSDVRQLTADKANLQLQVKQLEDTLEKVKQAEDMQAQLKVLQDQLQKEEKEKASLLEQLHAAQEQLTKTATQGGGGSDEASLVDLKTDNDKLRTLVSVGQDASRQQEELIEQLQKELAAVKAALAASRVSKMGYMVGWVGRNSNNTTTTTINNINSLEQQTVSTNGPVSEEQCQEDDTSRADTASLMSASSASVTDTNTTQVQSGASAKKTKKKKKNQLKQRDGDVQAFPKGFFGKLIGKSTDP
ncbi:nuclear anchorage protein 1-like isoform X6 [Homarus americanus]|uniref:nuclear anchorage protein 1-like isoform X6 n=1 Tax=Homarus americanus TaxID=6706 RepID=UPI001C48CBA2|nr:nuclear anchorage protein 1-like isoform X6 [Homarus americanus]